MIFLNKGWAGRGVLMLPVKCLSKQTPDSETPSPASPSSSSSISAYNWCAGIGGLGFLETTYLTYLKVTNSDAFCPIGGGSCSDVLNSDYAAVFGIPLFVYLCFLIIVVNSTTCFSFGLYFDFLFLVLLKIFNLAPDCQGYFFLPFLFSFL